MSTEKKNESKLPPIELIAIERANLITGIVAAGGEVDDETMALLDKNLDQIEMKAAAYLAVMDRLAAEAGNHKEISQAYAVAAKRIDDAYEKMRQRLAAGLRAAGMQSCKAGARTVSVQNGKQSLVIDNAELLPADCVQYDVKTIEIIDKDRVRALIEGGADVKGACIVDGPATIRVTTPRKKKDADAQAEAKEAA